MHQKLPRNNNSLNWTLDFPNLNLTEHLGDVTETSPIQGGPIMQTTGPKGFVVILQDILRGPRSMKQWSRDVLAAKVDLGGITAKVNR